MIKVKLVFYFLLLLISNIGFSQILIPDVQWQKLYGGSNWDYINTMLQTTDSGFILACSTASNNGDIKNNNGQIDIWIIKTDKTGTIEWQKTIGGTKTDRVVRITEGINDEYILTGLTYSTDANLNPNHRKGGNAWIVKLDNIGNIKWQKVLGGSKYDYGNDIIATPDNGYLMVGGSNSRDGDLPHNAGDYDVWIVKMDAEGTILWNKTYGGSKFEAAYSVTNCIDGGYIVSCGTYSNDGQVIGNHGDEDIWLLKIDNSGNLKWQKTYGGTKNEKPGSIQQTADKGFILCGQTFSADGDITLNNGEGDFWVLKLNEKGAIEWQKSYGGTNFDLARTVQIVNDTNYIVAGITNSNNGDVKTNNGNTDCWVIKLNSVGNLLWQKTIGGSGMDTANYIMNTLDGGYAISGSTTSDSGGYFSNHGGTDCWLIKLASDKLPLNEIMAEVVTNENIKVFPNYTSGLVNINLPKGLENIQFILLDIKGRRIHFRTESSVPNYKIYFENNTAPGIYQLNIYYNKLLSTYKIIYKP